MPPVPPNTEHVAMPSGDLDEVVTAPVHRLPVGQALCIRHGLTEWNAAFRWQGRADVHLADEGIRQAERAAHTLAAMPPFDLIVSSPLRRAHDTARIISQHLGLPVTSVDPRWSERDIGEWSGLTTEQIELKWPGMLETWRSGHIEQLPGGEREDQMVSRITEALSELLRGLVGRTALVVAHGGVLHSLSHVFGLQPRPFDNLEGRWFSLDSTGAVVGGAAVTLDPAAVRRKGNAL